MLSSPSMSSLPIRNDRPPAIINWCLCTLSRQYQIKEKRGWKWQKNLTRKNILPRLLDGQPETNPGSSPLSNSPGGYSLSSFLSLLYLIMGLLLSLCLARFYLDPFSSCFSKHQQACSTAARWATSDMAVF